jgi:hypothetical protein
LEQQIRFNEQYLDKVCRTDAESQKPTPSPSYATGTTQTEGPIYHFQYALHDERRAAGWRRRAHRSEPPDRMRQVPAGSPGESAIFLLYRQSEKLMGSDL